MSTLKIIAGLGCLAVALLLAPFAWFSLGAVLWFKFVPVIFTVGLVITGVLLIKKRRTPLSKRAKTLITIFVCVLIVSPIVLDFHIRGERRALQIRAKEFLVRPIPKLLIPNSEGRVGDFYVDANGGPQNGVFGNSRVLMMRFAMNGRIRWSARIQGEFACTSDDVNCNFLTDTIRTNEEVRQYFKERNAILGKIWAMGYLQYVEDTIEHKSLPPEIQEEDEDHRFVRQCEGTWTNEVSDKLTIAPDNSFSLELSGRPNTNFYSGDWIVGVGKPFFALLFTRATGTNPRWSIGDKAEFTIIHVDDRNLVYEVDNRTNSMSR